jgi:chromosome partitioning protein
VGDGHFWLTIFPKFKYLFLKLLLLKGKRGGVAVAVLAILNRKGGVSKTSLCANLGAELVALGRTVLLLDTDPQQSLTAWSGLGSGVLSTIVEAIDTTHPERFRAKVHAAAKQADRVLIDTPPGFADPALLSALLADLVLLPVGPSPLDIMAARDALALAQEARTQRGDHKPLIRFVPSKVSHTTLSRDLPDSLADLGEKVLPAIGNRVVVAEAALSGLTVQEYAPTSVAHEEFCALTRAVERLLK